MQTSNTAIEFINKCSSLKNVMGDAIPELPFGEWNLYELDQNCTKVIDKYGIFNVIEKVFDKDADKPVLVAMAGYSVSSFCGSSQVIMENLGLLNPKYKAVYVLCYDEEKFKGFSKRAADERDRQRNKTHPILETPIDSLPYREFVFGGDHGEIQMYEELGSIVDKVIRCLGLKNVHLLGKSAGGGTVMNIVYTNPIYTRLYLAVPAHPTYCKSLEKLGDRLNDMNVIVGWNQNDDRDLAGVPSNKNMELFEPIFQELKIKYPGFQYEQHRFVPGNKHEINLELLRLIAADV
jgi:hypothetical protein